MHVVAIEFEKVHVAAIGPNERGENFAANAFDLILHAMPSPGSFMRRLPTCRRASPVREAKRGLRAAVV